MSFDQQYYDAMSSQPISKPQRTSWHMSPPQQRMMNLRRSTSSSQMPWTQRGYGVSKPVINVRTPNSLNKAARTRSATTLTPPTSCPSSAITPYSVTSQDWTMPFPMDLGKNADDSVALGEQADHQFEPLSTDFYNPSTTVVNTEFFPGSPDSSLSSVSNGELFPDLDLAGLEYSTQNLVHARANSNSNIVEERRSRAAAARSRSQSRPDYSRSASSSRAFRSMPYPSYHARSNTLMSRCNSTSSFTHNHAGSHFDSPYVASIDGLDMDHTVFEQLPQNVLCEQSISPEAAWLENNVTSYPSYTSANSYFPETTSMPTAVEAHIHNASCHVDGEEEELMQHNGEAPDLFASIQTAPCCPSEEELNPSDPELIPTEQELRFEGDLYTPTFVRGHGIKREGFCGFCKPGKWLSLKVSSYWYHLSYTHGISASTGQPFEAPKAMRKVSCSPDVWEGFCGCCNEWISLTSSKKRGTTWFRHAYKCHTQAAKGKDMPKRRRDTTASGSATTRSASLVRTSKSATPEVGLPEFTNMNMNVLPSSMPFGPYYKQEAPLQLNTMAQYSMIPTTMSPLMEMPLYGMSNEQVSWTSHPMAYVKRDDVLSSIEGA